MLTSEKYNLRFIERAEYEKWDSFIDESGEGTIFHKTYWLGATKRPFKILIYEVDSQIRGGMALSEKRRWGQLIVSNPPLTPYHGLIYGKSEAKRAKIYSNRKRVAEKLIARVLEKYKNIYIALSPQITDIQPFIWHDFRPRVNYTYLLNLRDLNGVWKNMDKARRNDVTKAQKEEFSIEINDNIEAVVDLVEKTFTRQNKGIAGKKKIIFEYHKVLTKKNQCKSFIAKNKNGENVAAVYTVWDNKRSYYLLGGYDSEKVHRGAGVLAMWEAIKFTKEKLGLSEFDFEGSMVPQIEHYFRGFGGELIPYYGVEKLGWIGKIYKTLFLK